VQLGRRPPQVVLEEGNTPALVVVVGKMMIEFKTFGGLWNLKGRTHTTHFDIRNFSFPTHFLFYKIGSTRVQSSSTTNNQPIINQ
jgi:hypothetical protein